jgi:hypothetical protein
VFVLAACATLSAGFEPRIPRTFDPAGIASFEMPLAVPEYSPVHVSEDYYYSLPIRPIYRSYPIYHPDREPLGYRAMLLEAEPEIAFDETALRTHEDWIAAGGVVFRAPIGYDGPFVSPADVDDPRWYERIGAGITGEGVFPYARWVVREKGRLEVANVACSMCHTRLMPDGTVIEGAQGNIPLDRIFADQLAGPVPLAVGRAVTRELVLAPWVDGPDVDRMSREELAAAYAAVPPGVIIRQGTSLYYPSRVPDLIGIRDRKYLDATGLVIHRGPGDIMRYAAVNQTLDMLARYGDFVPAGAADGSLPPPGEGTFVGTAERYGDAQLYALALFLYSLEPPPNPNPTDDLARRGRGVFEREACGACHTPPLYTNNMLVAAPGFDPPPDHFQRYDVSRRRVGTDPTLATATRRGTGYYKVPSLEGLWYRGPLEHNGSVATLEDWFDPARTEPGYVPTGLAPADGSPRPVPGHPFGLDLSEEDRHALIAFLRTL